MFYGRTLLCFNGYKQLKVKIAKLFVLFVCSTLKSAEEENYSSSKDTNEWRTRFGFTTSLEQRYPLLRSRIINKICSNSFIYFLCGLILIRVISLYKRSFIVPQRISPASSSYQAFTASLQQISSVIWFRLYHCNFQGSKRLLSLLTNCFP